MVVLGIGVVTGAGKALLARQFIELTRARAEAMYSAFPRLLSASASAPGAGAGAHGEQQHTFVETDKVRYVYQRLDMSDEERPCYVVVVTNKLSNIVEDLEVTRLATKVVPEECMPHTPGYTRNVTALTEDLIEEHAFEIVFAFDELVSGMGHPEHTNLTAIKQLLEMDSQEERMMREVKKAQVDEARKRGQDKAKELDRQRAKEGKGVSGGIMNVRSIDQLVNEFNAAMDGGHKGGMGTRGQEGQYIFDDPFASKSSADLGSSGSVGKFDGGMGSRSAPKKGMALGTKSASHKAKLLKNLQKEGETAITEEDIATSGQDRARPAGGPGRSISGGRVDASGSSDMPADDGSSVAFGISETLSASISRDGGVNSLEISGTLSLLCRNEEDAFFRVRLAPRMEGFKGGSRSPWAFKQHPNVDKALFAEGGVIGTKQPEKPFPVGSALGVLKWRNQVKDESLLPLSVTCWPTSNGGQTSVSVEFELNSDLESLSLSDIEIKIPLPGASAIEITDDSNAAGGDIRFRREMGGAVWRIPLAQGADPDTASGNIEFEVPAALDPDVFFPIEVSFSSSSGTIAGIDVVSVEHVNSSAPVPFAKKLQLTCEGLLIE